MASQLTNGVYEKYGARYDTLTLSDGGFALTVTPRKGRHGHLLHQKRRGVPLAAGRQL